MPAKWLSGHILDRSGLKKTTLQKHEKEDLRSDLFSCEFVCFTLNLVCVLSTPLWAMCHLSIPINFDCSGVFCLLGEVSAIGTFKVKKEVSKLQTIDYGPTMDPLLVRRFWRGFGAGVHADGSGVISMSLTLNINLENLTVWLAIIAASV